MKNNNKNILFRIWHWLLLIAINLIVLLIVLFQLRQGIIMESGNTFGLLQTSLITTFRSIYSTDVVRKVKLQGIKITPHPEGHDNEIPLPASMTLLIAKRLQQKDIKHTLSLYSPYPFTDIRKDGGLPDEFARQAWQALNKNPGQPFIRIEDIAGISMYRYAVADILNESCAACHNSYPGAPKRHWKAGDVRGIFEVRLPLNNIINKSQFTFYMLYLFLFILIGLFITLFIKVRKIDHFKDNELQKQTLKVQELNEKLNVIVDYATDGIMSIDAQQHILFFNRKAEQIFGYNAAEVMGKKMTMLLPHYVRPVHQDNVNKFRDFPSDMEEKGLNRDLALKGMHKDGHIFPASVGISRKQLSNGEWQFTAFIKDITEQQKWEQDLRNAKESAEKANQAKSEFLSSISHELRTPMNAVLGFAQLLAIDTKTPLSDMQKESVQQIIKGGNHLLNLINDVLDLAKIEAGHIDISLAVIDIENLVSQICLLIQPQAEQRSIRIVNTIDSKEKFKIKADQTKIQQVLLNLSSNGIKYNNEHGTLTFSCYKSDNNKLRISVSDTGEGVSEELMEQMFDPFNRLNKVNSNIQGTGIGLTICKQLVELMQGNIGVFRNSDKGLTFWLEFSQCIDHSNDT